MDYVDKLNSKINNKSISIYKSLFLFNGFFLRPRYEERLVVLGDEHIIDAYRVNEMIYFNKYNNTIYKVRREKKKIVNLLLVLLATNLRILIIFPVIKKKWKEEYNENISKDFWVKYLGCDD